MPNEVLYWVETAFIDKLALASRPAGGDSLAAAIGAWKGAGVTHALSLLEPHEVHELGLNLEEAVCAKSGINYRIYPIADRGVPSNETHFAAFVNDIGEEIMTGAKFLIHCRAGIGRTGLVAASLLISRGMPFDNVFVTLSAARGTPVPDTDEQYNWVKNFAARQSLRGEDVWR